MGNYRFKLSDMMPNAWFYKLRDMSKSRTHNPKLPSPTQRSRRSIQPNNPYTNPKTSDTHFPNHHHDPPRKSCKKRPKRKTVYMPSPRKQQQTIEDIPVWLKPQTLHFQGHSSSHDHDDDDDDDDDHHHHEHIYLESDFSKLSSSDTDIIIDVDETSYSSVKVDGFAEFNMIPEPELPPILTRSAAIKNSSSTKPHKENIRNDDDRSKKNKRTAARKSVSRSGGVKIRVNGAKVGGRKTEGRGRRSNVEDDEKKKKGTLFCTESFAVVKASVDPERDFMESMMEMIVENNIRASKELEDLLACYLSLNSNQYHDLIIKAFEQIWFNMPQTHF